MQKHYEKLNDEAAASSNMKYFWTLILDMLVFHPISKKLFHTNFWE